MRRIKIYEQGTEEYSMYGIFFSNFICKTPSQSVKKPEETI